MNAGTGPSLASSKTQKTEETSMNSFDRRRFLKTTGAVALTAPFAGSLLLPEAWAQASTLTIAYNVALPSWDPTTGPSSVNPTIQSYYKSVFDSFIDQESNLKLKPGIITKWGWTPDKSKIQLEVRKGAFWHDGTPVTPEDVVWSLERAGNKDSGNPIQFVWGKIGNFKIEGNSITADVKEFEPSLFKWMAFLTGYILPKKAYTAAEADRFRPVHGGEIRAQCVHPPQAL
jgi:peptide/nickel transport system substrate-binding protein